MSYFTPPLSFMFDAGTRSAPTYLQAPVHSIPAILLRTGNALKGGGGKLEVEMGNTPNDNYESK